MSAATPPGPRVLHAVRTLGHASTERISGRAGVAASESEQHLRGAQASGWVVWSSFGGQSGGWSMTDRGRLHGERMLADELAVNNARSRIDALYTRFLPLNEDVASACSAWQLAELGVGEPADLETILARLQHAADRLGELEAGLASVLQRFAGYHGRFAHAVRRAERDPRWITAMDRDSCHRVWFELHEDLIATLGLTR